MPISLLLPPSPLLSRLPTTLLPACVARRGFAIPIVATSAGPPSYGQCRRPIILKFLASSSLFLPRSLPCLKLSLLATRPTKRSSSGTAHSRDETNRTLHDVTCVSSCNNA
ncbi:hypothetical protein NL676_021939 [Syzygium grande]|nr:hypothetical protein NL676_021939 [Syzygium grande]